MSGRFTAILLLLSAVRYALGECDGENGTCDVEEMAMLQSAKPEPPPGGEEMAMLLSAEPRSGYCKCAEPNGNNNAIMIYHPIWATHDSWYHNSNCPTCCQCTSGTYFKEEDIPAQCHGGDQCGTC